MNCKNCSKEINIPLSRVKRKVSFHFCSLKCTSKYYVQFRRVYPKKVGVCAYCNKDIIAKNSTFNKPNRTFCSISCLTTYRNIVNNPASSLEARSKISASRKHIPRESYLWTKERRIEWAKSLQGEKSRFWRGGLTSINRNARSSVEVKIWRELVFERDDYTCQICFTRGTQLNADHIKPWALYPELRYKVDNGRTLCVGCHIKTDTFGNKTIHADTL